MEDAISGHVALVDSDPRARAIAQRILQRVGAEVRCFGDAENCLIALSSHPCDLLITALRLHGGEDGLQLLEEVLQQRPWLPVLVVAASADVPMAVRVLKAGAADFLEKPLDREVFARTVEVLLNRSPSRQTAVHGGLSTAELRVLYLLFEGKSTREIAALLHRSPRTVEVHRSHVMHKMNAGNIVQLLCRAAEVGLFCPQGGPWRSTSATHQIRPYSVDRVPSLDSSLSRLGQA